MEAGAAVCETAAGHPRALVSYVIPAVMGVLPVVEMVAAVVADPPGQVGMVALHRVQRAMVALLEAVAVSAVVVQAVMVEAEIIAVITEAYPVVAAEREAVAAGQVAVVLTVKLSLLMRVVLIIANLLFQMLRQLQMLVLPQ